MWGKQRPAALKQPPNQPKTTAETFIVRVSVTYDPPICLTLSYMCLQVLTFKSSERVEPFKRVVASLTKKRAHPQAFKIF